MSRLQPGSPNQIKQAQCGRSRMTNRTRMKLPEFDDETHDFDMGLMRKEVENTRCSKTSQVVFAIFTNSYL